MHFLLPSNASGTLFRGALQKLNTSTEQGEAIKRWHVPSVPHLGRRFTGEEEHPGRDEAPPGPVTRSAPAQGHDMTRSVSHRVNLSRSSHSTSVAARTGERPPEFLPEKLSGLVYPRPWDSPSKNTGVGCHFLLQCMKVKSESKVAQLCPTLSNPMNCSLPGSSVHGIPQARVLEWGATAFSEQDTIQP